MTTSLDPTADDLLLAQRAYRRVNRVHINATKRRCRNDRLDHYREMDRLNASKHREFNRERARKFWANATQEQKDRIRKLRRKADKKRKLAKARQTKLEEA